MTRANGTSHEHPGVFEHKKRREWGLGVLAWETSERRGYVFESGHLRVLAQPFFSMMQEVERPDDEVVALYKCLQPEIDAARAEAGAVAAPKKKHDPKAVLSFEDQLAVFSAEYPAGFADTKWLQKQRGAQAPKRLASHRDPVLAEAQELFAARRLNLAISEHAFGTIYEDIHKVLRQTDLVPTAERKVAESRDPERQRLIAIAVTELLHGKADAGSRFARFLTAFQQAVGQTPGWQLATALPALVEPSVHICVRPPAFRAQAKWIAPRLTIPAAPTVAGYLRCQEMARLLNTKLTEQGMAPRDLMDIHDFIRSSARPQAKRRLAELKWTP